MIEIIKASAVGFICCKSLKCFGKKDYSEIIAFVTWLYVGAMICLKIGGWYNSFMNSAFMKVMIKIFG